MDRWRRTGFVRFNLLLLSLVSLDFRLSTFDCRLPTADTTGRHATTCFVHQISMGPHWIGVDSKFLVAMCEFSGSVGQQQVGCEINTRPPIGQSAQVRRPTVRWHAGSGGVRAQQRFGKREHVLATGQNVRNCAPLELRPVGRDSRVKIKFSPLVGCAHEHDFLSTLEIASLSPFCWPFQGSHAERAQQPPLDFCRSLVHFISSKSDSY